MKAKMSILRTLLKIEECTIWIVPSGQIAISFTRSWVRKDGMLIGTFGTGDSVVEAAEDYYSKIRGEEIVIEGFTPGARRSFYVV